MVATKIKNFKNSIKSIPIIYSTNAYFKARHTTRQRSFLINYYKDLTNKKGIIYSVSWAKEFLTARLLARGIIAKPREKGQLRIFWVGTNESQDNSGFLQALQKFGDVTVYYDVNGQYGMLGSNPERHNSSLISQVQDVLEKDGVDILIGQMLALRVSIDVLQKIQSWGITTVNISMDDRLPGHWLPEKGLRIGSVGLCNGLDLVLTSSLETCNWYAVENCPALYWPMASDPNIFQSLENKIYDVSFVGGRYGLREKIVNRISQAGIKIVPYGPGWDNGSIGPAQMADVFGGSKIILGMGTVGYNQDILTIKLRDFDAPMAGALYLTHRNPDLLQLFKEGQEIECYETIDECIRKIKFYLAHPKECAQIGKLAALRARKDHTWEKRLGHMFQFIGLLK
jgi:spore maturation protein CgeB